MDPGDIALKAAVDKLISKVNLHRMRGQYAEAEDVCREALSMDGARIDVRELLADMIYARGQLDTAMAEYKNVLDQDPKRVSAETKYAWLAIEVGEREYQKRLAQEMLENPGKVVPPAKSPLLAFITSACLPGTGQIYVGELRKGLIILGAFLLSMAILAMTPIDTGNLLKNFGALIRPVDSERNLPVGGIALFCASVLMIVYIYAVIDAPIAASKVSERARKIIEGK
jgi:tetratricopeptide (TPR) repeat protein